MHNDRQTGLIDRTANFQQSLLLQMAQRVVDHVLVPWPRFLASEYLFGWHAEWQRIVNYMSAMAGHAWQPLSSQTEVWFCWTSGSSWNSFTWPFLAAWLEEIRKYIVLFADDNQSVSWSLCVGKGMCFMM